MRRFVIVFVGGGLGAATRALIVQALASWATVLPLPILLVNVAGAFVLGIIFILADETELLQAETRLFLAVGILGGFTTFGTFAWGTDSLLSNGKTVAALVYAAASVAGAVLAVTLGLFAGRELVDQLERGARHVLSRLDERRTDHSNLEQDMAAIETENREDSA